MKNSEESDEDVADSAVWSSLIGNIVAIIISAYLWLLQQNPNRKNRTNFNPDQLNNALKDLKHMAQELTKQNETINESQCTCDETADGTESNKCKAKNVDARENKDKSSESVLTVNSVKNNTQDENKNSDKNDPHEKICDICMECLNNAISSETTTSLKTSPIDQEYRPYEEPEHVKKGTKSKKYDKCKIKKGIADAQRAIQYLQRIQNQFETSKPPNKSKDNYDKMIKKANFQEPEAAKRQNRTVIKYDSEFLDESMPYDYNVECSSSCSLVKYETITKPNPNNQNKKPQKQPDYNKSYPEEPKRKINREQDVEGRNAETCTYMEDPCDPCERLKPNQLDNGAYVENTSKSSENEEVTEQDEENCTYMEDPCKPCEVKPNVPISRLPPTARKVDPRKPMNFLEGGRVAGCPVDGRPCFVEKCSQGPRQPNVMYQNVPNGNRSYGQRPKSPRPSTDSGSVPQNYRQPVYTKIPASDNRRQDYEFVNQRLSPRGNYPPGYGNYPKYEKAMNTLTVERMDACSETGELLQNYNQHYQMNNQQFVNQLQQKQFENQQVRQRDFAKFKRPVMIQQKEEDYRRFPHQHYQEVRYRNEELPLMPVAAIPLKSSSNTLDVSKCPRYLK